MNRLRALLLLSLMVVAMPLTSRPASAAGAGGSTYTIQILNSGCVSGAKARQEDIEDPSGRSPALTGPVTVVFTNGDICRHCITGAGAPGMVCVDPKSQATFDLGAKGSYDWADQTAQSQDYVQGASGTIIVSSIATPPAAEAPTAAPASPPPPAATTAPVALATTPAAAPPDAAGGVPSASTPAASDATVAADGATPSPTATDDSAVLAAAPSASTSTGTGSSWIGPALVAGAFSALAVAGLVGLRRRRQT